MEGSQRQDEILPRNWQFILKDSASVLDGVLEENEARKLINLQINKHCHFALSASIKIYK